MRTHKIAGSWYCDALPDGSYVASSFDHPKITILNGNEIRDKALIWTVIGPDNQFTGVGHNDDIAWLWIGNNWIDKGKAFGTRPIIYKNNELIVIHGPGPTGSQGWRYVDDSGVLVSSDDSMNPQSRIAIEKGIKNLWEFTVHKDIAVGQGQNGVFAVIGNQRVRLDSLVEEQPNCRAVRFHWDGDKLSVAWYFFVGDSGTSCFLWITEEELRALFPVIVEPTPTGEKMIKAFNGPFWQAPYYSFHKRYGDTDIGRYKEYGNAITIIGDEQDPLVRDTELERLVVHAMPLIVDIGTHPPDDKYLNLTVAWLAAGNSIGSLWNSVGQALQYAEKPIIAYLDSDEWPDNNPFNSIPNRVWPAIMAYRMPDETLESFKNRLSLIIQRVDSYGLEHMILTSRFDDFNGDSTIERTMECAPLYEHWIREYNMGHMPFADRRGNGIAKNGPLFEVLKSFNYAIPFERPNRFDYWKPKDSSIKTVLENKFGQQRASVVIENYLREDILDKYDGSGLPPGGGFEEPDINEPLLHNIIDEVWDKHDGMVEARGIMLNEIAWRYNQEVNAIHVGMSAKPEGNNIQQPHTGTKIAFDIIQVRPPQDEIYSTMYDVFNDNGTQLGVAHPHNNPDRIWIAPVQP